ncbi:MAG: peptidyl-tRNA hydrolase Pth2 [Candidatus Nitrosopolaris sp.]
MTYKQVIVVRRDLRMGIGKMAAQVAHAAVLGAERTKQFNQVWFHRWFESGQAKVVVKVQSFEELIALRKDAENMSLIVVQVEDRGLTQIPAGTTTCIGIGPAPTDLIDRVTSHLKLL